jgi:hypothetical protein
MIVVFLDVDGVLNSESWNETHKYELMNGKYIDEHKVELFSVIIKNTNAVVVMHSGWRLWLNKDLQPIRTEAEYLLSLFKKYQVEIYDKTPDFSTEEIRKEKKFSLIKAKEINAWLDEHMEVLRFLILDDLDLNDEDLSYKQIRTDSKIGLTEDNVKLAIKLLRDL